MDMNDVAAGVPVAEIILKYIDLERINKKLLERISTLSYELNPEAAEQLMSDAKKLSANIIASDNTIKATISLKESYLIEYLSDHDIPVSGGENGVAHNVDGTVYNSAVDPKLWGNELESLMLPIMDVNDEEKNYLKIILHDETEEAMSSAASDVAEYMAPNVRSYLSEFLTSGGGSK